MYRCIAFRLFDARVRRCTGCTAGCCHYGAAVERLSPPIRDLPRMTYRDGDAPCPRSHGTTLRPARCHGGMHYGMRRMKSSRRLGNAAVHRLKRLGSSRTSECAPHRKRCVRTCGRARRATCAEYKDEKARRGDTALDGPLLVPRRIPSARRSTSTTLTVRMPRSSRIRWCGPRKYEEYGMDIASLGRRQIPLLDDLFVLLADVRRVG